MTNKDDILEYALNNGIKRASLLYNVPESEVEQIVDNFKDDIEDICDCRKHAKIGINVICFACPFKPRIKL